MLGSAVYTAYKAAGHEVAGWANTRASGELKKVDLLDTADVERGLRNVDQFKSAALENFNNPEVLLEPCVTLADLVLIARAAHALYISTMDKCSSNTQIHRLRGVQGTTAEFLWPS